MRPEQALAHGHWVKLICGASNQDPAGIEDLCGIYTLAGVHCIDVAADPAVVAAARRGIGWGLDQSDSATPSRPWLMVSLSDGEDPHFRKAWFDPLRCPPRCPRPCQRVCPALAIAAEGGVRAESCYGCGRCLPVCPQGLIEERGQVLSAAQVAPLLARLKPDLVELHTQPGRGESFALRLDQVIASGLPLRHLAVSCGWGEGPDPASSTSRELWQRFALLRHHQLCPIWQLDGRPMSGDIGDGTAHAALRLLTAMRPLAPPGPLQLAGGTNGLTLPLLRRQAGSALAARAQAGGVAFGGMARSLLQPLMLEAERGGRRLLEDAALWPLALERARRLVGPWLAP
ncbi:Fe-S cluster containing protein [Synechococcus sp. CS-1325]|uniref:Light dependent period protein LdpA domain-containing protein n=1 Tax=unclassified Synechococcus TaxID=2626047 RepID=UPI000DB4F656|nr:MULTISPECIES: LdpA C-terminal domain-containing domain [unclassified Synechococcus]PZV01382.1 MAG: Fe-S cluster containing protein [Cyanobium sp.]MCT0198583.1 Fe-S cluster containing protein [Synechococcus sp. CS-1325]MCT0213785.1 Fe-S cluster containing protein [Synechococcus sp. CS-1326]MCT0229311.1 Fe-S cluster containing protein [Synechococcus sp. CS-1324]MCT0233815.1 Fe-S cluster containing protein [Synechococcus sp. CS-1327]